MEKITEPANLSIKKVRETQNLGPFWCPEGLFPGLGAVSGSWGACFDAREGQISTGNRPSPEIDDLDSVFSS